MTRPKRHTIVVVTDRRLIPPKAGYAARIVNLLAGLRAIGYRTVLIAPRHEGRLSPALPALVGTLRLRRMADRLVTVKAPSFVCGAPNYDCAPYGAALARVVRRTDPVAVIAAYCWMAPSLDAVTNGAVKVVDTHDLMHVRGSLYGDVDTGAWVVCTREEEAAKLAHADVIMAIQPHEQREFKAMLPDRRVICVPHVAPPVARDRGSHEPRSVVAFVGSWNGGNQQGVEWFVRECWPEIRRRLPGAEFLIYGGVVSRVPACASVPGVRLIGRVNDLTSAYRDAAVVINPVHVGTGLKIKTVEALAFGRALVTTSCGAAGLEHGAGQAYILADDAARFAGAVADLLRSSPARTGLERAAVDFASQHFTPAAVLRELTEAISSEEAARA